jgi:predicted dinucleotide-binding enzyme
MRIGILGSGMVGRALGSRLVEVGHQVRMGSRTDRGPAEWATATARSASASDYAGAAAFGELIINATPGTVSLQALARAGAENLAGKILLDVANPIETASNHDRVALSIANTDSLAEQIQRDYPTLRVVKALNTMNCEVMVRPDTVPGEHVVFMSGDDPVAKARVAGLLEAFGWPSARILDLGGLATARGTEAFLLLWLPIQQVLGQGEFNIVIAGRVAG